MPDRSESENPVIPAPTPKPHRPRTNQDWWPNQLDLLGAARQPAAGQPDGRRLRLRRGVRVARCRRAEAGRLRGDDDVAGLVAGRLRPLRPAVHPDDVARRGHVPHPRRPRRWRQRPAALRAAQQLARQREPRQGAPVALAGQAEVRPEDLLGRPDRLRRQLSRSSRWGSRRSASASGARTSGSRTRSSGVPRTRGSATSATAATGSSPVRSARCRWASST